jgi:hypothetical protein
MVNLSPRTRRVARKPKKNYNVIYFMFPGREKLA